jgi:hypothetical protein
VAEDGVDTLLNLMENVPSSMHRQVRRFVVNVSFFFLFVIFESTAN